MKKNYTFLVGLTCLVLLMTIPTKHSWSQWHSLGPGGGFIYSMSTSGDSVFAITGNTGSGLYVSPDRGLTWELINSSTIPSAKKKIAKFGNTLLLGCGSFFEDSGIYRSLDEGKTWQHVLSGDYWITSFVQNGSSLFVSTLNYQIGVLRSTDGGETWIPVNNGLPSADKTINTLISVDGTLLAACGNSQGGVYRSDDNGETWSLSSDGLFFFNWDGVDYYSTVTAMSQIDEKIFAAAWGFGIVKSSDKGLTWEMTGAESVDFDEITSIVGEGNTIFASSLMYGIARSLDGGDSWEAVQDNGIAIWAEARGLAKLGGSVLVGTKGGVYRTENDGAQWVTSALGLNDHTIPVSGFQFIGSDMFVGTQTGGVYRSPDKGLTWFEANNNFPVNSLYYLRQLFAVNTSLVAISEDYKVASFNSGESWEVVDGSIELPWVYHGERYYAIHAENGLVVSANNGQSWEIVPTGFAYLISLHSIGGCLYLGHTGGLSRSLDGTNWESCTFGSLTDYIGITQMYETPSAILAHLHFYGRRGIYRSTDGGLNWIKVSDLQTQRIVVNGHDIYASGTNKEIVNGVETEVNSIFYSDNSGLNWTKVSGNLAASSILTYSMYAFNGAIYVSTRQSSNSYSIKRSSDKGQTWVEIGESLPVGKYAVGFLAFDEYLYAITTGSIWRRKLTDFTAPQQPTPIAGDMEPCVGSDRTYSVEPQSGVTYTWQVPAGWSITSGAGTHSITVTVGSTSGLILVIPSNPFGTGTSQFAVATPQPNVIPSVSVIGAIEVCAGSPVELVAMPVNGGTPVYEWLLNGVPQLATGATFTYLPANGDEVGVTMTTSLECVTTSTATAFIVLTVEPLPTIDLSGVEIGPLCVDGEPVELTGALPENGTYSGLGVIDNKFHPNQAGIGEHTITYTFASPLGCSESDSFIVIVNSCTGVGTSVLKELSVYPNPALGEVTLSLGGAGNIDEVQLYNMMGSLVRSQQVYASESTLTLWGLPAGVYVLRSKVNGFWLSHILKVENE